ncbi:MAG: two-component system response regulator [Vampirovibrio sp.]|jgi:two-component system response regulator|nr:two-component system response regulator [Vampirovibrio sp.]
MDIRPILIVEDNSDDQLLLANALEAADITSPIKFVKNGKEAQDYLFKQANKPSALPCLVFLDLTLPEIGGMALLKELRATPETRRLPVIVFTGSHQQKDLLDSYSYGANSYVVKGGTAEDFYDKIHCLCHYWLHICKLPAS